MIAVVALMLQSYIVTEDDHKRLDSQPEDFTFLVTVLDCAVCGRRWKGFGFCVMEIIKVRRYAGSRPIIRILFLNKKAMRCRARNHRAMRGQGSRYTK